MKAVLQWVLRTMMKDQTGVMRTLPRKDIVDFNVAMTAERLMRNGIDPNSLKNANQVENALNMIENRSKVQEGIKSTKTAKIMDLEGKEIDPRSRIMGGKQAETEAEIAERLNRENKEAAQKIRDKKRLKESDADSQESSYDDGPADFDPDADDPNYAMGGRAGFFMGGASSKGLGLLRAILNYMSKTGKEQGKFKGADLSGLDMLRLSNPKRFNRLLEDVRGKVNIKEGIMGTDTVRAMQQAEREKRKNLVEKSLDVAKAMKADDDKIKIRLAKEAETTIIPQVKKQLMEGMGMSEEAAEKAARGMAEATQNMRPLNAPPKITEEGILQLENVLKNMETGGKKKRELNAIGGRAGFADGTPELRLFPRASGRETEQEVGPGIKISERDLNYGITGLLQGDKFFGGAELDKGKVKIDVVTPEGDTLFKDTIGKKDAVNFILGMGDPKGEKFQIKTDKDFENMQLILKKSFADGGRASFDEGGMTRRTFLKLLGGMAAVPIVGKFFKLAKVGKTIKKVPMIKTGDVPGKPEWFDQLVNKVILEGDDVTKRFATQERQVVHMKKIDDETSVTVTQDLNDGSIMVDVDDPIRNVMGESGDDTSVQMLLKKNPGDESNPAGADEFSFTEADMRNYMDGPDDYTTEFTENTVQKMSDLTSDLGKIKSYATGKKPTMKQFIESKKRQDKVRFAEEKPAEYAAERGPDIDYSDYDDGMASGGIARMLGE